MGTDAPAAAVDTNGDKQTKMAAVNTERTKGVGLGFDRTTNQGTDTILSEVAKMKKKANAERQSGQKGGDQ